MNAETQPFDEPTLPFSEDDEEMEDVTDKDEAEEEEKKSEEASHFACQKLLKVENIAGPWNLNKEKQKREEKHLELCR